MCYFDQTRWACGYWRWGHFRQQCSKEYRTGEICGLKLVYNTNNEPGVCKICKDIDKKQRKYTKLEAECYRLKRLQEGPMSNHHSYMSTCRPQAFSAHFQVTSPADVYDSGHGLQVLNVQVPAISHSYASYTAQKPVQARTVSSTRVCKAQPRGSSSSAILEQLSAPAACSKTATKHGIGRMEEPILIRLATGIIQGATVPLEEPALSTRPGLQPLLKLPTPAEDIPIPESPTRDFDSQVCEPHTIHRDHGSVIDSLMEEFYALWKTDSSTRSHSGGGDSEPSSNTTTTSNSNASSQGQSEMSGRKRQRTMGRALEDKDNCEDDEENRRGSGGVRGDLIGNQAAHKFACPYYQRDPESYAAERTCSGPGWKQVHRVKEHVYRRHAMPIHCPRCFDTFHSEISLTDHFRQDNPCEKRPQNNSLRGYSKDQEKLLKQRPRDTSEETRWRDMYRILFPLDDERAMPSPYFNCNTTSMAKLAQYDNFLRRETPRRVRMIIEAELSAPLTSHESELLTRIPKIIEQVQEDISEEFRRNQATVTENTQPGPALHEPDSSAHDIQPVEGANNDLRCEDTTSEPEDLDITSLPEDFTAFEFDESTGADFPAIQRRDDVFTSGSWEQAQSDAIPEEGPQQELNELLAAIQSLQQCHWLRQSSTT